MDPPRTQYDAKSDGVNVAYQVVGEGPFEVLVSGTGVPGEWRIYAVA